MTQLLKLIDLYYEGALQGAPVQSMGSYDSNAGHGYGKSPTSGRSIGTVDKRGDGFPYTAIDVYEFEDEDPNDDSELNNKTLNKIAPSDTLRRSMNIYDRQSFVGGSTRLDLSHYNRILALERFFTLSPDVPQASGTTRGWSGAPRDDVEYYDEEEEECIFNLADLESPDIRALKKHKT